MVTTRRIKKKKSDGSLRRIKYTTHNGVEFSTLVGCCCCLRQLRVFTFKKRKTKQKNGGPTPLGWGRSRVPVLYIIAVFNQLAHAHTVNEKVPSL